jgi:predicted nucleotidyltransferase
VTAVYIFGSYATGKEYHLSDIDIGVLLDKYNPEVAKNLITDCIVELGRILRKDIHPVILNSASEELLRQIFLKGRSVMINDSKKLAYFKMVKFVEIADFSYYRSQMQSGLIKQVLGGGGVG